MTKKGIPKQFCTKIMRARKMHLQSTKYQIKDTFGEHSVISCEQYTLVNTNLFIIII